MFLHFVRNKHGEEGSPEHCYVAVLSHKAQPLPSVDIVDANQFFVLANANVTHMCSFRQHIKNDNNVLAFLMSFRDTI